MTGILVVLGILLVIGVCMGLYAWLAPRAPQVEPSAPQPREPWHGTTDWTKEAGAEFAGLSEGARCDLIFAVTDLNDERSHQLLVHALDDPSDAVALAAAHALEKRGSTDTVTDYVCEHPGERAQRIQQTLALLH